MAKTKLRVLDGEVMEFYNSANATNFNLYAQSSTTMRLERAGINILELNTTSSGTSVGIRFMFDGTTHWLIRDTGVTNEFSIQDVVNSKTCLFIAAGGDMFLQQTSGKVAITTSSPVNALLTVGNDSGVPSSSRYAAYFGYNLDGATNPTNNFGMSIGWNRSGGNGETNIVWGTGAGGAPSLIFSSWSGSVFTNRITLSSAGLLGIGIVPVSSYLHIAANTTTVACMRLDSTSAALLTSVTADCIEYDGEGLFYTLEKTLRHALGGTIYLTDTEAGTTANSGSEASVLASSGNPIDWETLTIPANYMVNGKTLRLKAWGYFTSNAASTTYTVRFKFGSTYKATATFTVTGAITRKLWACELSLTCRNSGVSAYFQPDSSNAYDIAILRYDSNGSGLMLDALFNVASASTNTFDTTASNVIDLTCAMSGTYTTAVFKCATATIELIGA